MTNSTPFIIEERKLVLCRQSGDAVTVPDDVCCIGRRAFARTPFLQSLTVGPGVTEIEKGAFEGCDSLKELFINTPVPFDPDWFDNDFCWRRQYDFCLLMPYAAFDEFPSAMQDFAMGGFALMEQRHILSEPNVRLSYLYAINRQPSRWFYLAPKSEAMMRLLFSAHRVTRPEYEWLARYTTVSDSPDKNAVRYLLEHKP